MAEGKKRFNVNDVVEVEPILGLPADLPAGLRVGLIGRVNAVETTTPAYPIEEQQLVCLANFPPGEKRWYNSAWFRFLTKGSDVNAVI